MRLIDVDALREKLELKLFKMQIVPMRLVLETINEQPTVDAVPVKRGRWIHDINNLYGFSECMGRETMSPKKLKPYCPNCGARMDGDGNG